MMNDFDSPDVRRRRQVPTVVFALVIILSFYIAIFSALMTLLLLSGYSWT